LKRVCLEELEGVGREEVKGVGLEELKQAIV
jgi:hypothetical protein